MQQVLELQAQKVFCVLSKLWMRLLCCGGVVTAGFTWPDVMPFFYTLWLLFWLNGQRITVNGKLRSEGVQLKGLWVQLNLWPCRQDASWMCGACYLEDELQGHPMTSFHGAQNPWQRPPAERFSHCGSTVFTLHRENRRHIFPSLFYHNLIAPAYPLTQFAHFIWFHDSQLYGICHILQYVCHLIWNGSTLNLLQHHIWSEWKAYVHLSGLDSHMDRFVSDPLNSGKRRETRTITLA